ncbi:HIT family protein [Candidatus Woesearchaeota archaeon]|nr:HIT family protein [Candidatus Woesearchaeota archaeon]
MACVICDKLKEKKAHIIYEDDLVTCIMPSKGAAAGHMRVLPNKHATKLDELDESTVERLFMIANYSSASAFDMLKAHGTNIILNEGEGHIAIDVLPRKEGDGLDFLWPPKEMPQNELDEIYSKVKDKTFVIGKSGKKEEVKEVSSSTSASTENSLVPRPVETIVIPEKKPKPKASEDKKEESEESKAEEKPPVNGKGTGGESKESDKTDDPDDDDYDPADDNYMIRQLKKIP